jgi:hypothetical protein
MCHAALSVCRQKAMVALALAALALALAFAALTGAEIATVIEPHPSRPPMKMFGAQA